MNSLQNVKDHEKIWSKKDLKIMVQVWKAYGNFEKALLKYEKPMAVSEEKKSWLFMKNP